MYALSFSRSIATAREFIRACDELPSFELNAFDAVIRTAMHRHEFFSEGDFVSEQRAPIFVSEDEFRRLVWPICESNDLLPETIALHMAQAGLIRTETPDGFTIPFAVYDMAAHGLHRCDQLEFSFMYSRIGQRKRDACEYEAPSTSSREPGAYIEHFEKFALREALQGLPASPTRTEILEKLEEAAHGAGAARLSAEHVNYICGALGGVSPQPRESRDIRLRAAIDDIVARLRRGLLVKSTEPC
jgi:hypothetical protein